MTARDIAAFSAENSRVTPLFHGAAYEIQARFSPDNRWIGYASNETGRWEVFVEPFPQYGPRWQVSADGGSQPLWRRDGKELFFLAPGGKLMVASVNTGETFAREAAAHYSKQECGSRMRDIRSITMLRLTARDSCWSGCARAPAPR